MLSNYLNRLHNILCKLLVITFEKVTFRSLHVIQCNISAMRVTGPAGLSLI